MILSYFKFFINNFRETQTIHCEILFCEVDHPGLLEPETNYVPATGGKPAGHPSILQNGTQFTKYRLQVKLGSEVQKRLGK